MDKRRTLLLGCAALALTGCTDADDGPSGAGVTLTRDQLMDPETCKDCHPQHYREWASSMHAYAAEDPVFLAMNRRGQRETGGELGDFCVNCHAPMAVLEGVTADGLDLEEVDFPKHLKGVTCYYCHNVVGVSDDHNASLVLANDTTMRGGITDPVQPKAHRAEYSEWHDRNSPKSSLMCGACHDIVTPAGVHLERTLQEYKESIFGKALAFESCAGCHMSGRKGVAATDEDSMVPLRTVHEHLWAGVDVALTDFPGREAQKLAVECELANGTRIFNLEPNPLGEFLIALETFAGHRQPSGATQDRRMWVEFIAYDAPGAVIFESGNVADDEIVDKPEGHPDRDPNLWLFRDYIYDENGDETHMFWEAAPSEKYPNGYVSKALPATVMAGVPHTVTRTYRVPTLPDRVTVRLRIRPMGLDVLQDLVDSGDLDPAVMAEMPTFTLNGAVMEWTAADGFDTVTQPEPNPLSCPNDYLCKLNPDSEYCD